MAYTPHGPTVKPAAHTNPIDVLMSWGYSRPEAEAMAKWKGQHYQDERQDLEDAKQRAKRQEMMGMLSPFTQGLGTVGGLLAAKQIFGLGGKDTASKGGKGLLDALWGSGESTNPVESTGDFFSATNPAGAAANATNLGAPEATGMESIWSSAPSVEAMGSTPFYIPAAVAASTYLAGKEGLDVLQGKGQDWGDASNADKYGRAQLGVASGGLSEVARLFGHKSTKDREAERWQELANQGINTGAGLVAPSADDLSKAGIVDHGANFNADLIAGNVKPEEVWGSYGLYKTFGNDWLQKYNEAQRKQIAQKLIDERLLNSEGGDVMVTDPLRAQEIAAEIEAANQTNSKLAAALG